MGEDARPVRRPIVDDRLLGDCQIRVGPTEVAEELFHLTAGSDVGDDELTGAGWESDRSYTRGNEEGVEVLPAEDRLEGFRLGEEHPSGVEDDPNACT